MVAEQAAGIREVLEELAEHGLRVLGPRRAGPPSSEQFLRVHFATEILPVLTPLAVEELDPLPAAAGPAAAPGGW